MTAGWVAGTVRGRALLHRSVGSVGARSIADAESWPAARRELSATPYGAHLPDDADRMAAHRAAAIATLWHLRVLAGWLPPGATGLARLAAGPFEIANIEHRLARVSGASDDRARSTEPLPLASLAAAWPRVEIATSVDRVRAALSGSVWGDPGGTDAPTVSLGLRVGWARRLQRASPLARPWGSGMLGVLIAREQFAFERPIGDTTARELDRALGRRWRSASTVAELRDRLPDPATWALAGVDDPSSLWQAELAVIRRVVADAEPMVRSGRYGRDTMVAVLALLLADLWRVGAAIEAAGRDATRTGVFDALAA